MAMGAALGFGGGAALTAAGASASAVTGLSMVTTANGISTANSFAEQARGGGTVVIGGESSASRNDRLTDLRSSQQDRMDGLRQRMREARGW